MEYAVLASVYSNKDINSKTDEEVLNDIVLDAYFKVYNELENKCRGKSITYMRQNVPSTKEIHSVLTWDFDAKAYDIRYGISVPSEATIADILNKKGCIFKWAGLICNDAQLTMFDLEDNAISL